MKALVMAFQADMDSGRLERPKYNLGDVSLRAEKLSSNYSGIIGSRSLDLLHVAAALECGCSRFASTDEKQRKVAELSGLDVFPKKSL